MMVYPVIVILNSRFLLNGYHEQFLLKIINQGGEFYLKGRKRCFNLISGVEREVKQRTVTKILVRKFFIVIPKNFLN